MKKTVYSLVLDDEIVEKVDLLDLLKRICTLIRLQVAAVAEFFGNQRTDTGQSCIDRL